MRTVFILIFVSIAGNSLAQNDAPIVWGSKPLEWSDFKAEADQSSHYKAITYSEIKQILDFDKDSLKMTITAEFIQRKSWVAKKSDYLLQHEQLHFDIVEYVVRLFRKSITELSFESYDDIKPKLSELFTKFSDMRKDLQKQYDKDTDHSIIRPQQEKWNEKVKALLEEEAEYAEPYQSIYIGYLRN